MGIILTDSYVTQQGVELPEAYVSFAMNAVIVQPYAGDAGKMFSPRSSYDLFANVTARREGCLKMETGDIVATAANVTNPYSSLYEQLKIIFPDYVDDL
jgi:hypothetical protein